MKEFWKKNKEKIILVILGTGAVTGLALIGVGIFGKKAPKIPITGKLQIILPEFQFEFDTIEEAVAKFVELGDKAPVGTIALWNRGVDGAKYIVQDLT